jgi:hypothetical protein
MKKHNLTKDEKKEAKAMRDNRKGKRMLWQSLEIKEG